ncbi:MAG: hypothetical protein HZC37_18635 [Burkholderiales bacterium]|nr:hypothetical protein [Burkholderiales bacterium]
MSDDAQIAGFLAKYAPAIVADLQVARAALTRLVPRGYELVYDNYNALAFGFGPTPRASDVVISLAAYPKWVTLFFLRGASLADPACLLQGSGSRVRSVRLSPLAVLESAGVQDLLGRALAGDAVAFGAAPALTTIVKSVSAKQRPRQPPGAGIAPAAAKPGNRPSRRDSP